jgi:hypothetical protein
MSYENVTSQKGLRGDNMTKTYYTRDQAMERFRMKSINAFQQLVRKYPDVFVNLNSKQYRDKNPWYDKAAVDKLAAALEALKQEKL